MSCRRDRKYVDGLVLERNLGERDHSRIQGLVLAHLVAHEKEWRVVALVAQRVQVKATRFRVPDVCVVSADDPDDPIVQRPPIVCIEILSQDDRMSAMHEKVDDYLAMGVRHVWLIDPSTRRAYDFTTDGMGEPQGGLLKVTDSDIVVPMEEIFRQAAPR
jgi:Uma2 family endonuclease